ncbi:MAG TPA: RodZ domain-containing protein [Elusimicrobiales bacterium]|nr:RodZ domain-containing protein [Elusimicrobiales bacterium]
MNDKIDTGKLLKKTRIQKGYSLEFIHSKLKISIDALKALEENNFKFFPAKVYFQGFLQEYLIFLEIDPAVTGKVKVSRKKIAPKTYKKKRISIESDATQNGLFSSIKPLYLKSGLVFVVLMSFLTVWLWKNSSYANWKSSEIEKNSYDNFYQSSFVSILKINFVKKVWIKMKSDGETKFEGFVAPGKVQTWKASKNFSIETANPNAFSLMLDKRLITPEITKGKQTIIPVTFSGNFYTSATSDDYDREKSNTNSKQGIEY